MAPMGQLDAIKGMRSSDFKPWTVFHPSPLSLCLLSPPRTQILGCCLLLSLQGFSASPKRNKAESFSQVHCLFQNKTCKLFKKFSEVFFASENKQRGYEETSDTHMRANTRTHYSLHIYGYLQCVESYRQDCIGKGLYYSYSYFTYEEVEGDLESLRDLPCS